MSASTLTVTAPCPPFCNGECHVPHKPGDESLHHTSDFEFINAESGWSNTKVRLSVAMSREDYSGEAGAPVVHLLTGPAADEWLLTVDQARHLTNVLDRLIAAAVEAGAA